MMTAREKGECSFKPHLPPPMKEIEGDIVKLGFIERRDQIKQKFTEKHEKIKTEKSKYEVDSCTFKPELRKRSLPNYTKKIPENKQLKKFLERQKQAYDRKSNDKNIIDPSIRIKPNINDAYEKLFNPNKSMEKTSLTERDNKKEDNKKEESQQEKKDAKLPNSPLKTKTYSSALKNKTNSPLKKSPQKKIKIDVEKQKLRSQLHSINSISIV